jgi:hypothetical protein
LSVRVNRKQAELRDKWVIHNLRSAGFRKELADAFVELKTHVRNLEPCDSLLHIPLSGSSSSSRNRSQKSNGSSSSSSSEQQHLVVSSAGESFVRCGLEAMCHGDFHRGNLSDGFTVAPDETPFFERFELCGANLEGLLVSGGSSGKLRSLWVKAQKFLGVGYRAWPGGHSRGQAVTSSTSSASASSSSQSLQSLQPSSSSSSSSAKPHPASSLSDSSSNNASSLMVPSDLASARESVLLSNKSGGDLLRVSDDRGGNGSDASSSASSEDQKPQQTPEERELRLFFAMVDGLCRINSANTYFLTRISVLRRATAVEELMQAKKAREARSLRISLSNVRTISEIGGSVANATSRQCWICCARFPDTVLHPCRHHICGACWLSLVESTGTEGTCNISFEDVVSSGGGEIPSPDPDSDPFGSMFSGVREPDLPRHLHCPICLQRVTVSGSRETPISASSSPSSADVHTRAMADRLLGMVSQS